MSKLEVKSIVVVNGKEIPVKETVEFIAAILKTNPHTYLLLSEIRKPNAVRFIIINSTHIEYVKAIEWQQEAPMSDEEIAKRLMR